MLRSAEGCLSSCLGLIVLKVKFLCNQSLYFYVLTYEVCTYVCVKISECVIVVDCYLCFYAFFMFLKHKLTVNYMLE